MKTRVTFLGLAAVLAAGCYAPKIQNGTLPCSVEGDKCPGGFQCVQGFCCDNSTVGVPGTGVCANANQCFGPVPNCTEDPSGACDPVCQAGCECDEICRLTGNGPDCHNYSTAVFQEIGESCAGSGDVCEAGSVCLSETNPSTCGSHCYRFCRDNSDCADGAKCIVGIQGSEIRTCSAPTQPSCNPVGAARCGGTDRPDSAWGCYILSQAFPDLSVCDCKGTLGINQACNQEHQCQPGLECVSVSGRAECRRVCNLTSGVDLCGAQGLICTPFTGGSGFSQTHGYCS